MFRLPFNGSDGSVSNMQEQRGGGERMMHSALGVRAGQRASKHGVFNYAGNNYARVQEEMDSELWYACAGPQHTLPPVNSLVAYFPQGHIEQLLGLQVASFNNPDVEGYIPHYNLPACIPCTLNHILLSADQDTDEVFATLTLCPVRDPTQESSYSLEPLPRPKPKSVSFTKVLTQSDTSTHGGFSVPRRGAEDCFPPLDKTQDNPIQDLMAKDLHGNDWKFRHLFRGQPKRHLLTTGWSVFVSQKRLVAGDCVLFLRDCRGEDGQLRIAVRLAPRQKMQQSIMVTTPTMAIGVLEAAAHAAAESSRFSLIYNPRSCPSQYVIPYSKYAVAMKTSFSVGQRIKSEYASPDPKFMASGKNAGAAGQRNRTRFEAEDSSDARLTGTITDISDYDHSRWPGSVWRSLQVNWDDSCSERQDRVNPWEINPFAAWPNQPAQDKTRKTRYRAPPAQIQTTQLGQPMNLSQNLTPGSHYRVPDPLPNFGGNGIQGGNGFQDLFNSSRNVETHQTHQGESEFGMQVYRAYKARCDIETSLQPCSPRPTSTLHSFVKTEPYGDSDLQLRVSSVAEDQTSSKSSSSQQQPSLGPLRDWLPSPRSHPENRAGAAQGGQDCTALSMGNLPPADSASSNFPPAPKPGFWANQTQPAATTPVSAPSAPSAPSHGEYRCRLFGVSLDRPATPPESKEDFSSKQDSYNEKGPSASSGVPPPHEAAWSGRTEVDWQPKMVHEQAGFKAAERSTYNSYGDLVPGQNKMYSD